MINASPRTWWPAGLGGILALGIAAVLASCEYGENVPDTPGQTNTVAQTNGVGQTNALPGTNQTAGVQILASGSATLSGQGATILTVLQAPSAGTLAVQLTWEGGSACSAWLQAQGSISRSAETVSYSPLSMTVATAFGTIWDLYANPGLGNSVFVTYTVVHIPATVL